MQVSGFPAFLEAGCSWVVEGAWSCFDTKTHRSRGKSRWSVSKKHHCRDDPWLGSRMDLKTSWLNISPSPSAWDHQGSRWWATNTSGCSEGGLTVSKMLWALLLWWFWAARRAKPLALNREDLPGWGLCVQEGVHSCFLISKVQERSRTGDSTATPASTRDTALRSFILHPACVQPKPFPPEASWSPSGVTGI